MASLEMPFTLVIRFGRSSSKNYPDAVNLLEKFSDVTASTGEDQNNSVTISKEEFAEKHQQVVGLLSLVRNWKNSQILINNQPTEFRDLDSCFSILRCHEKYKSAIIQEEYCKLSPSKEGWGCKWLQGINRHKPESSWPRDRYWYHFGSFSAENIWTIDKNKIRSLLQREIEIKRVSLCPAFNPGRIEEILAQMPDSIDTAVDTSWQILYEDGFSGTTAEKRPVAIQPATKREGGISISLDVLSKKQAKSENDLASKPRYIPEVGFADIGGIDEIIETVREVIELPIKKPDILRYLGIKPHKGILLHGTPGCGKTLIAKAIANEIKAHFILIRGPELFSKWHGESEENLRNVFEEARQLQPSIIYFDEIDSVAQARSGEESLRLDARFINQLLTLMDGVEDYGNVCVIASTNRVELIDNALLRPGRFDYKIEVKKPTLEGCFRIFEIQTKNMPVDPTLDKREFSKTLFGLTGADITFVAREGAYNCLRRNIDLKKAIADDQLETIDYEGFVVTQEDFELALSAKKRNSA
ncbi:MAG: AAA family ATPase [Terriglobia bacterium]